MTPVPSSPVALLDQLDELRAAEADMTLFYEGQSRVRARAELIAALPQLTAAVRAVLEKCEQMEREAPKPQVGGFMAEEFRRVVTAALSVTP